MKTVIILILSVVNMICFGQNISDLTFGLIKPKVACPDTLRMKNALQTPVIEMDYYKENGAQVLGRDVEQIYDIWTG